MQLLLLGSRHPGEQYLKQRESVSALSPGRSRHFVPMALGQKDVADVEVFMCSAFVEPGIIVLILLANGKDLLRRLSCIYMFCAWC